MYVYKSTSRKTDIILVIISMLFSQISNSLKKRKKNLDHLILSTSSGLLQKIIASSKNKV